MIIATVFLGLWVILKNNFLFVVYPSILEWVDTLVCFLELNLIILLRFMTTFKISMKESQILYMNNISKEMKRQ